MGASAVNHLGQFLQQLVFGHVCVHLSLHQVVVSKLADELLKVIHGGGGDGTRGSEAQPSRFGRGRGLLNWTEIRVFMLKHVPYGAANSTLMLLPLRDWTCLCSCRDTGRGFLTLSKDRDGLKFLFQWTGTRV